MDAARVASTWVRGWVQLRCGAYNVPAKGYLTRTVAFIWLRDRLSIAAVSFPLSHVIVAEFVLLVGSVV